MSTGISTLASQCPALSRTRALASWVGDGRPVTPKGVLRPADVPSAAGALGVEVGEKVRSAADVVTIHRPWVAAEGAGLIEVGVAEAVARPPHDDPAQLWLKGLDAVLRAESADPRRRGAFALCRAVLTALANGPLLDDLVFSVHRLLKGSEDGDAVASSFGGAELFPLDAALDVLTEFGALDGDRKVTPLGHWALDEWAAREPRPVTPELRAAQLLGRLAPLPADEAWHQALRWFEGRRPVDGAAQLLHAAEFASPVERVAAIEVVAGFGDEVLPAWHVALSYRNVRPHAAAMLEMWDEGPGLSGAERRRLVTEYALSARERSGVEEAYHYVRDRGGLDALEPEATALRRELRAFAESVRLTVYQLKITVTGRKPPQWWRLVIPASVTLGVLAEALDADGEEHHFEADGVRYADPFFGLGEDRDEHDVRLSHVLVRPGTSLRFFVGAVEHSVTCEKILDPDPQLSYPRCTSVSKAGESVSARNKRLAAVRIPHPAHPW
ncbi:MULTISPECIES: plasmid pRiA4b ORF-3 family protein [Amycolatopsis]|uniref:plasmid pRiA4b ORF-3 family protein n=1 Tax=Amycolatopsis TaxID=1813 RepID=UPI001E4CD94B|nr:MULTISPECIES: plasmid pRiA4b ORF-3 family protein [Amycolatopsis]